MQVDGNISAEWSSLLNADSALHEAMQDLLSSVSAETKKSLKLCLARYKYGSIILSEGVAKMPDGRKLAEEFLCSDSLPLGLITKGPLDVVDGLGANNQGKVDNPVSMAHLLESDFFGVFEVLDSFEGINKLAPSDWTIYSGINSIQPAVNVDTNDVFKKLNKGMGARVVRHAFVDQKLFGQKIAKFIDKIDGLSDWHSEIIYFNKSWRDLIFGNVIGKPFELQSLKVRNLIHKKAWKLAFHFRNIHFASKKYFYLNMDEDQKRDDRPATNRAYRIFESLVDVSVGRRPVFVAHGPSRGTCHLDFIKSEFLVKCGVDSEIMRPVFMPNVLKVAFVPFNYVLPELVAQKNAAKAYENIKNSIAKIVAASNLLIKERGDEKSVIYLRNFKFLVSRISVRIPASEGRKMHYQLTFENDLEEREIKPEVFFAGMNFEGTYVPWQFFTHCLKIDFTNFSWE